ncbi:hypothetical protein KUCAC02_025114 [Chaenocephalus aceratus]|nr:hypothetical protein KUCAC02_025114 [Chaenocephalus aceratus]
MSHLSVLFQRTSFTQFFRMHSDQARLYGDEFVDRYCTLLVRIRELCSSAFSMVEEYLPIGPVGTEEPKRNRLVDSRSGSTWIPENDAEFFADAYPGSPKTESFQSGNAPRVPPIHCTEMFNVPLDGETQELDVCTHGVGECDRNMWWTSKDGL